MKRAGQLISVCLLSTSIFGASSAIAQSEPLDDQQLYLRAKSGTSPERLVELCLDSCKRYSNRYYPRVLLGDSYFRLHKIERAIHAYQASLALMGARNLQGVVGKKVRGNLETASEIKIGLLAGIALENKARWTGWTVLSLIAVLVAWVGWGRRK